MSADVGGQGGDGRPTSLLAWVLEHAPPDARVYRSADGRVVVIDESAGRGCPRSPAGLLAAPGTRVALHTRPTVSLHPPTKRRTLQP